RYVLLWEQKGAAISSGGGDDAEGDDHPHMRTHHLEEGDLFHLLYLAFPPAIAASAGRWPEQSNFLNPNALSRANVCAFVAEMPRAGPQHLGSGPLIEPGTPTICRNNR